MNNKNERRFLLRPIDAWFFRDGRPYNVRESNQTGVESAFPPNPQTVVGAIRAALARSKDWNGKGRWNAEIEMTLGNGFDDLGELNFTAPLPARIQKMPNGKLVDEPLFPMPLHVVGTLNQNSGDARPIWTAKELLAPANALKCDLGEVELPAAPPSASQALKNGEGYWTKATGLARVIAAQPPINTDVIPPNDLWKHEHRVGLARNDQTHAAEENMLYSPVFVRPLRDIGLAVTVSGLPSEWHMPELITLGGEGRMAEVIEAESFQLPAPPSDTMAGGQFVVVLLSPLCLPVGDNGVVNVLAVGDTLPGFERACIVSACVGKPIRIGGWNSLENTPLPLRPFLPAGSVFFCKCDPDAIDDVLAKHGDHIGDMTAYGFGRIVIGFWPNQEGDS